MHSIGPFLSKGMSKLSSVPAMAAIVSVMVVVTVLLTVSTVIMTAVLVAVGMYDSRRWRHHYHTRWWRRSVIVPVPMPVAIIIARFVGTIGTG